MELKVNLVLLALVMMLSMSSVCLLNFKGFGPLFIVEIINSKVITLATQVRTIEGVTINKRPTCQMC